MIEQYKLSDLHIDMPSLLAMLGFEDPVYHHIVDREMAAAEEYMSLCGGFVFGDSVSLEDGQLTVGETVFDVGRTISAHLRGSERVAMFVCTAGSGTEIRSRQLNASGDIVEAFVADAIGSAAVEAAVDKMQKRLSDEMSAQGLKITNRYSPGYCGWATAEQRKFFGFFPDAFCGVTLTESALMQPVKSVSGVIGIGHNVKFADYTCTACTSGNCIYRSIKERKRQ